MKTLKHVLASMLALCLCVSAWGQDRREPTPPRRRTDAPDPSAPRVWIPGQKGRPAPQLDGIRRPDPLERPSPSVASPARPDALDRLLRRPFPETPIVRRPNALTQPETIDRQRLEAFFGEGIDPRLSPQAYPDRTARPLDPVDLFVPQARDNLPLLTHDRSPDKAFDFSTSGAGPSPQTGRQVQGIEESIRRRNDRLRQLSLGLLPNQSITGLYRQSSPVLDSVSPAYGRYRQRSPYIDSFYNARSYGFGGALEGYRPWSTPVDDLLIRRQSSTYNYGQPTPGRGRNLQYDLLRGMTPGTPGYGRR